MAYTAVQAALNVMSLTDCSTVCETIDWISRSRLTAVLMAILGSLRSTTRRHDDALSIQRNLSCKTKALNNLWSQGYPPQLSHSQHNVKLSINTSFEQRESLLRRKSIAIAQLRRL